MPATPHRPRASVGRSPIYERWGLPLAGGNSPPQLPDPTAPTEPVREEPAARGGGAAIATLPAVGEAADLDWPVGSDPAQPGLRDWRRMAPVAAGALLSVGVVLAAALGLGGGSDVGPSGAPDAGRGSGTGERAVIATPPPTAGRIEVEAVAEINEPTTAAATQSGEKATPRSSPVASPVTDPAPSPPDAPPPPPPPPPPTALPTTTTTPPTTTTEPPPTTTEPSAATATTLLALPLEI